MTELLLALLLVPLVPMEAEPPEEPMPEEEPEVEPDVEPRSLVGPLVPEDDAPVVPDVPELLDVLLFSLSEGGAVLVDDEPETPDGVTLPLAEPPAEPMPDAEPDTDPLALGLPVELPDELVPLGGDEAQAASVKAQATGMIHLFIEISFVFFIGGKAIAARKCAAARLIKIEIFVSRKFRARAISY